MIKFILVMLAAFGAFILGAICFHLTDYQLLIPPVSVLLLGVAALKGK